MPISKEILTHVENELSQQITGYQPVSGGSINQTWQLQTDAAKYFIKINNLNLYPGMFKAEAAGLNLIAGTNTIKVPEIVMQADIGGDSFLLLEWINSRRSSAAGSALLGLKLAEMHKYTAPQFGLNHSNYMGSLPQSNNYHTTWSAFFIEERLQPLVKTAADKHLLNATDIAAFEKLYKNLPGLFTEEAPSLIHGDLWSGNYLIGIDETPYLIDPAVTYGHREFDIAMTTLFGGFSNEFYLAYNEHFSLAAGWEQRIDLWNLYPLLVHLILFGTGYLGQVRGCLRQYL